MDESVNSGENKRAPPTALHMSLSLGPTNSLSMNRKSLIMESMGDKDIVKRAFKTFQNRNNGSNVGEKSSTVKHVSSIAVEPKKVNGSPLQKSTNSASRESKNLASGENKRAPPTALHMSLSLGPTNSLSMNRKSLIMESMRDKDIVKRAFKTFQNRNNGANVDEKSSTVKHVSSIAVKPKIIIDPVKGNKGLRKDAEKRPTQRSQLGTRSNPLPSISITKSQKASKAKNPEQNQEQLLLDLPSEIVINILSKLSVRTVATCKCVCKLWLNLIKSPEFVKSHLSESKPGLVLNLFKESREDRFSESNEDRFKENIEDLYATVYQITEFEDSLGIDTIKLDCNVIMKWDFLDFIDIPNSDEIQVPCVANGFLFVMVNDRPQHPYYICNPVTREYIEVPNPIPEESEYDDSYVAYGFGVSKWTGQYKLIRIFHEIPGRFCDEISNFFCHVYTLGTGSWRSIKPVATFSYPSLMFSTGTFLNGILHWLVYDLKDCVWVSCFDLETEIFSTFSPPPNLFSREVRDFRQPELVASGDYLYICDDRRDLYENGTAVWVMKEYGVGKSWTKAFVMNITTDLDDKYHQRCLVKVYGHGCLVMLSSEQFFYYSNETKTATEIMCDLCETPMLCRPNFLSLRSFPMENTKSF